MITSYYADLTYPYPPPIQNRLVRMTMKRVLCLPGHRSNTSLG